MPDPAVVTLVSWAIAVKAASNEETLSGAALAAALAGALAAALAGALATVAGVLVGTGGGAVVAAAPLHAPATIAVMAIAARNLELGLMKSSPPAPLSLVAPRVARPGHNMVTGSNSLSQVVGLFCQYTSLHGPQYGLADAGWPSRTPSVGIDPNGIARQGDDRRAAQSRSKCQLDRTKQKRIGAEQVCRQFNHGAWRPHRPRVELTDDGLPDVEVGA